ncbi:hypothetical protein SAMN05216227_105121 [Pseudorhodobacter antarcticus]|uniref:Uncharacterized protein n=1 Tax=Pseudorhodobacter antarcticus TaxID=1077947 RepID=A0A1H8M8Z7_9RHOB|nr:hypothetical protein SAMN05216227_105121 [Pseudorhodobacter antarcticus]
MSGATRPAWTAQDETRRQRHAQRLNRKHPNRHGHCKAETKCARHHHNGSRFVAWAIAPLVRQSPRMGPNKRLRFSRSAITLDPFAKHKAARITNGVVGKTGSTMPAAPKPSDTHPSPSHISLIAAPPRPQRPWTFAPVSSRSISFSGHRLVILSKSTATPARCAKYSPHPCRIAFYGQIPDLPSAQIRVARGGPCRPQHRRGHCRTSRHSHRNSNSGSF